MAIKNTLRQTESLMSQGKKQKWEQMKLRYVGDMRKLVLQGQGKTPGTVTDPGEPLKTAANEPGPG